ncbi:hypothetical protein FS749_015701 [Ceratobasidium sp. UAMH 11750]|nr:hypothetical protein FS749_015701 [Ceratobasidium sp. UAMH 11750]
MTTAYLGVEDCVTRLQTASGIKDPTAQIIFIELIRRGRELKKSLKVPGKQDEEQAMTDNQAEWLGTRPVELFNVLFQIYGALYFLCLTLSQSTAAEAILSAEGLDPYRGTVEILHTILLGIEKYAWYSFHSSTKPDTHKIFETRLQSADMKGLDIDSVRASYIVRFKNNLIGRHFKTLMQLTIFQVHDLVSAD